VAGIAAVMDRGADGEIFNIGASEEICIADLARLIHQLAGSPTPLRLDFIPYASINGTRYEDVRRRVPDTTKAKTLLGFEAKIDLRDGLRRTIEWQRGLVASKPALTA
jgi:UDP-glucose 4-epimerase